MCLFRYTLLFPQKHPTVFAKTPWCFVFGTFLVSFAKVEFFGTVTRTTIFFNSKFKIQNSKLFVFDEYLFDHGKRFLAHFVEEEYLAISVLYIAAVLTAVDMYDVGITRQVDWLIQP